MLQRCLMKRSLTGAGPKLALWALPGLAISIAATSLFRELCRWHYLPRALELVLGGALLVAGLALYLDSAWLLLRDGRKGMLITRGAYAWSQNPLYGAFIFFLVPAASLLFDSWPLLLVSVHMYAGLEVHIGSEYRELEATFGDAWRLYRTRTSELFPLPPGRKPPGGSGVTAAPGAPAIH